MIKWVNDYLSVTQRVLWKASLWHVSSYKTLTQNTPGDFGVPHNDCQIICLPSDDVKFAIVVEVIHAANGVIYMKHKKDKLKFQNYNLSQSGNHADYVPTNKVKYNPRSRHL